MKGMKPDLCCCSRVCVLGTEMRISVKPSLEYTPQRFSCKIGNELRLKTQPWGTPRIQPWRKKNKYLFCHSEEEKKREKVVSRRSEVAVKGCDLYPEMLFIPGSGLTGGLRLLLSLPHTPWLPLWPLVLKKEVNEGCRLLKSFQWLVLSYCMQPQPSGTPGHRRRWREDQWLHVHS